MDLRQLRYFVAVARERNFTRAAETLRIAQPPLSRQIQLLEEELGVALVIRSSRPVRLTEAGRVFYEQALQILGRVEQMREATRRVGLNQNRVLSIGFVASTLYGGLPALVRKLRQHAPDLDIQLLEMMSVHQLPALKEGRIDIGFGRLRHTDPQVVSTVLREERLAVALPDCSLLSASADPLPISALAVEKLIVYPREPRPSYADQVLGILLHHNVHPQEVQDQTEDLKNISVPTLVMHGDDDQIVPIAASAEISVKLLKNGVLKVYKGFSHGMLTVNADVVNPDLLAFVKS